MMYYISCLISQFWQPHFTPHTEVSKKDLLIPMSQKKKLLISRSQINLFFAHTEGTFVRLNILEASHASSNASQLANHSSLQSSGGTWENSNAILLLGA